MKNTNYHSNSYQSSSAQKIRLVIMLLIVLVMVVASTFAQQTPGISATEMPWDEITSVFSEKYNLKSASFYTGESSLTKGNTLTLVFEKDKKSLTLDLNNDLGEVIYFYSPKDWYSVGFSGGYVYNTPWFGPIGSLNLFKGHLTTLHWFGWSTGNPEERSTKLEASFCFSYQKASINIAGFQLSYANQIYQHNDPEHIFDIKKSFKINNYFSTFASGGYMLNSDKFLWSGGICLTLK